MCARDDCPEAAAARQILADIAAGRVPARPWDGSGEIEPPLLEAPDVVGLEARYGDWLWEVYGR